MVHYFKNFKRFLLCSLFMRINIYICIFRGGHVVTVSLLAATRTPTEATSTAASATATVATSTTASVSAANATSATASLGVTHLTNCLADACRSQGIQKSGIFRATNVDQTQDNNKSQNN